MNTRKYCVTYHPIEEDSETSKLYFTISEPGLIARDVPTLEDGTYDESVIIDQVMRQFKEFWTETTSGETAVIPEVVSITQVPVHDTSSVDPHDSKLMEVMSEYTDHADSMEELLLSLLTRGMTFTDEELQNLIDRAGDTEYLTPEDLRREVETKFPMWAETTRFIRLTKKDDHKPVYIAFSALRYVDQCIGYTSVSIQDRGFHVTESADVIMRCMHEYYQAMDVKAANNRVGKNYDVLEL